MFASRDEPGARRCRLAAGAGLVGMILALGGCTGSGRDDGGSNAGGVASPASAAPFALLTPAPDVSAAQPPLAPSPVAPAAGGVAPPASARGPVLTAGSALPASSSLDHIAGYQLVMQDDGNLVLYAGEAPLWSSGTEGRPGAAAELRTDGNLVVAGPDGAVAWSSGTAGSGAIQAVLTDAGNLELRTATGAAVWQAIAPAAPPAATERGPAAALIAEINAYREANGLGPLRWSAELTGYAQSCAQGMAAVDGPLVHCRTGEIIQYNSDSSPSTWFEAYRESPAHDAIMLLQDVVEIGGAVIRSPGGLYYSVVNVSA